MWIPPAGSRSIAKETPALSHRERAGSVVVLIGYCAGAAGFFAVGAAAFGFQNGSALIHSSGA